MKIHVISKSNNADHATVSLEESSYPEPKELGPDCVRVRPVVISLTSNNLSYARLGDVLHWWDTYPVPKTLPAPYNDATKSGIVPAWGYAIVTETTASSSLKAGAFLFGFWPTASIPIDLKLAATDATDQWTEISDHRQNLMTIYNQYQQVETHSLATSSSSGTVNLSEKDLDEMAYTSLFYPIWQTGYLLSKHTFTAHPDISPPIYPLGIDHPWSDKDADLTSAAVISLSASGKTARSFAWHILRRGVGDGPLGFGQVTSQPEALHEVAERRVLGKETSIKLKTLAYSALDQVEALEWVSDLKPEKIVIVDFGGRGGALRKLLDLIKNDKELEGVKIVIIHIGDEPKMYSQEELQARGQEFNELGKIRFNTSNVKDEAIRIAGANQYHETVQVVWEEWLQDRWNNVPDLKIVWGKGVAGDQGIEGGWERLCRGSATVTEGLVYRL